MFPSSKDSAEVLRSWLPALAHSLHVSFKVEKKFVVINDLIPFACPVPLLNPLFSRIRQPWIVVLSVFLCVLQVFFQPGSIECKCVVFFTWLLFLPPPLNGELRTCSREKQSWHISGCGWRESSQRWGRQQSGPHALSSLLLGKEHCLNQKQGVESNQLLGTVHLWSTLCSSVSSRLIKSSLLGSLLNLQATGGHCA